MVALLCIPKVCAASMNVQPSFGIHFIVTDLLPYFRVKYFCATTGQRLNPASFIMRKPSSALSFGLAKHVVQLYRGKSFDMQLGTVLL